MASKRHQRRRACSGKQQYTREYALIVARRMCIQYPGQKLWAYHCKFGNHWHVGHPPAVEVQRLRAIMAANH